MALFALSSHGEGEKAALLDLLHKNTKPIHEGSTS
jgi:hypothetical protein